MLPIGTVITYAGPLPGDKPEGSDFKDQDVIEISEKLASQGWLPCHGQKVAVAKYPDLFRVVKMVYGRSPNEEPGWFLPARLSRAVFTWG